MAGPRCHTCGPMTSSLMHLSMPDRPSQLLRLPQPQPRNRNASLPPGQPQSINHLQCSCSLPHSAESEVSATCIPSQDYRSASRRQVLLASGAAIAAAAAALPAYAYSQEVGSPAADTTITDRVYFDLMMCPSLARSDRTLGNRSVICMDGEDLGRIVIGLYGKQVPQTVRNFKEMCTGKAGSSYEGTIFNRVLQGQYIQAGRQGSKDKGEVPIPANLDRNQELISVNSFKLRHTRPGTVSLCLSENDDDDAVKLSPDYRNVEFLITTGPGPAPQLDNGNIVFGTVLEGMDVVAAVSTQPTYRPSSRIRQFNDIAEFLGDDRAANARALWDKPLKAVVIKSCGLYNTASPHGTLRKPEQLRAYGSVSFASVFY